MGQQRPFGVDKTSRGKRRSHAKYDFDSIEECYRNQCKTIISQQQACDVGFNDFKKSMEINGKDSSVISIFKNASKKNGSKIINRNSIILMKNNGQRGLAMKQSLIVSRT